MVSHTTRLVCYAIPRIYVAQASGFPPPDQVSSRARASRVGALRAPMPLHSLPTAHPPTHLPACNDGTAYASLLSIHASGNSTFMARHGSLATVLSMLLVLVRSVRHTEPHCRRDFILICVNVALPAEFWEPFNREGVIRHTLAQPILAGVPAADKLELLKLTQYRKIMFIDSDVLVVDALDDLFERTHDFSIAHHPYDLVQAQCGVAPRQRGVGALYVIRPNHTDLHELRHYFQGKNAWQMHRSGSEQTALVCHYKASSRLDTLPCSVLFDLGTPKHARKGQAWRTCRHLSGAGDRVCDQVAVLSEQCSWPKVGREVRAIHFKGKMKPWHHGCGPELRDTYRVHMRTASTATALTVHDRIWWDQGSGSCRASRAAQSDENSVGQPAIWGKAPEGVVRPERAEAPVQKPCCGYETLLRAEWYRHLQQGWGEMKFSNLLKSRLAPNSKWQLKRTGNGFKH